MKQVVHAACPHDCPDACGVLITVENGRATRIQGDPAHPVTRGFLCAKVAKYLDRVYSPGRVLYPLRRIKPKGPAKATGLDGQDDAFVRISWDEALDEVVTRFRQVAREFGPESILPFSYGGTLGVLNNASMDRRFFHRLGASQLDRTICSTAGEAGLIAVLGGKIGTEPEQFRHSRTILVWGTNVHTNNVHLWPFIEEARRHGGKLIVIDPYPTRTARCADWYSADSSGHRPRAGAGHDARHHRRGSGRLRLRRPPHPRLRPAARARRDLYARVGGPVDGHLRRRHPAIGARVCHRAGRRQSAWATACSAAKTAARQSGESACCRA